MENQYEKYIRLLEANKNIIFTGAPGTGKTYLAKAIAKEMDAELEFVQFHPSYDYTDFVEGLRPVSGKKEGEIGFERKDGIFKRFCKKALKSLASDKLPGRSFEDFYNEFLDDIQKGKVTTIKLRSTQSSPLHVSSFNGIKWDGANGNKSANSVSLDRLQKLYEKFKTVREVDSIKNIDDEIREVIGGANTTYFWGVLREVLSRKEAYENSNNSDLFDSLYQSVINDIKSGKITSYTSRRGVQAPLRIDENNKIKYRTQNENPKTEKVENIKLMFDYLSQNKIYDLKSYKRKDYEDLISKLTNGRIKTLDYVEYGWILQELLNRCQKLMQNEDAFTNVNSSSKKYVFIIDEINRGEISKIFGELFFSIDPGYRGASGKVKTQYQNLIGDKSDPFYEGFYVPENVYIIGTMNDIDRSVESIDFAMRRRFGWIEIEAKDNLGMLDELGDLKEEVKEKMTRLNNAIWNKDTGRGIDGLGSAYHIGGAYFRKLVLYMDGNNKEDAYRSLWNNHLRGILLEYLRGNVNVEENLKALEKAYYGDNES